MSEREREENSIESIISKFTKIQKKKKKKKKPLLSQMNNATALSDYNDNPIGDTGLGGVGYGVGLSIAVLVVFVVITYFSYKCKRSQTDSLSSSFRRRYSAGDGASVHVVIHRDGLDAAAISAFPLYTYGQLKPHKGGGAAGCAVCLSDFKESEEVRLLPECGHVFHRSCIDPWLMIHPTCPICRNSPLQTAVPTPLPASQPAPVANQ
ncbi:putative RING-H2 finger protein ATL71 [Salvia miltiorrhiza]|uniref:putative RING-H2 finger protein ATL71 n=1 Tax=Salvia miltiorrhiza TaxID=226208 RepID=UPI0025ABB3E4|nr:putative RING-H2 finger protein ATL71 [Salvia miltiorrhiza]